MILLRITAAVLIFQSTLPARGATLQGRTIRTGIAHFNPRSLHGERRPVFFVPTRPCSFQSTLPARGATQRFPMRIDNRDFNPRSLHGERLFTSLSSSSSSNFNPRSLHGERRNMAVRAYPEKIFQSTLPARGATGIRRNTDCRYCHFNPRSLHGERPCRAYSSCSMLYFNPRSLHGERLC